MTTDDDIEPTLDALGRAGEALNEACHAAYHAPETPQSMYARCGELVDILGKVRQLAHMMGEDLDKTERLDLGTDDGSDAIEHVAEARRLLLTAALQTADAGSSVNAAWSQVSPLSLRS